MRWSKIETIMKIAVIETGGKQYLVSEGQKIQVEKLPQKSGDKFDFDKFELAFIKKDNIKIEKIEGEELKNFVK